MCMPPGCNGTEGLSCHNRNHCSQDGCDNGLVWNKELQICDLEENVTCPRDIFWLIRRGAALFKTGLHLATIAHGVTSNLLSSSLPLNNTIDATEYISIEGEGSSTLLERTKEEDEEQEGSGTLIHTEDDEDYVDNYDLILQRPSQSRSLKSGAK